MKLREYATKDGYGVLCLAVPLLFKWMLPPGLEARLYDMIGPINLFIPNILLAFAPLYFQKSKAYFSPIRFLFIAWCFVELVVLLGSDTPSVLTNVFCNSFLFGALYLGLFHKISDRQIRLITPLLLLAVVVISIQIIALSSGLISYDFGNDGIDFAGIIRVYTTAGDSNRSGETIAICTFFILLAKKNSMMKWGFVILSIVGAFLTVSRSVVAVVVLASLYFCMKYFRRKIKYLFGFVAVIVLLYTAGVFDPIMVRMDNKLSDGDFTAGRDVLVDYVLRDVDKQSAELFGLGVGNVYQSTEVLYSNIHMPYPGAPHNFYVLLYAEQGIVGVFFFALLLAMFFKSVYRKNPDASALFLIVLGTIFNSETGIGVNSEMVYNVSLLMLLMNRETESKLIYTNRRI